MTDIRVRSALSPDALKALAGKVLGPADIDVMLTGRAFVRKPDGRPLVVYLPGVLADAVAAPGVYETLHGLRRRTTANRGMASGTRRVAREGSKWTGEGLKVSSVLIGAVDPMEQRKYCRLTSWTGQNLPAWQLLHPLLRAVARQLAEHVPDRYAAQAAQAARTDPAWTVPGTPFSTVTVNNTYPTGVHTDKGDLDAGFSTIACLRRGQYEGGQLVFPQYRVGVDLRDGDLILMDAHEWHGNTAMVCGCGKTVRKACKECGAERISVVSYFRTAIADCADPATEEARAYAAAEKRSGLT